MVSEGLHRGGEPADYVRLRVRVRVRVAPVVSEGLHRGGEPADYVDELVVLGAACDDEHRHLGVPGWGWG